MKEKLIIRNFGPIKDVELDLGRFNILIGEQATGKSTVAKVLAVCRYFSYIIGENNIFEDYIEKGLSAWGLTESIKIDTYIYYQCDNYEFTATRKKRIWKSIKNENDTHEEVVFQTSLTPISDSFKNLLSELRKIKPSEDTPQDLSYLNWTIPTSFFLNDVKNVMDNPFYLPTERGLQSIFSLGQASIPNLANFLFNYYSKIDGVFKYFKTETEIEPLGIFYININGVGYIRKKNEQQIYLLANAASGYQSIIPVVLVIKYQTEIRKKNKTFIIEEPELNLFPVAQNNVMQYLVDKIMNTDNNVVTTENKILLTTHSPYILTALNNMMFAYQVGQINAEKASAIIEKKYWIDYNEVSAYMMKPDGTAENIMDEESMQIKGERIDEVSGKFNKDYDDMLDIKYATVNEG